MANNLTGDFEAVLQITVRKMNGLLAGMHQRGIDPAASPSFEHSGSVQVGDSRILKEVSRFQHWVSAEVKALHATGESTGNARSLLTAKMPAAVSAAFQQSWSAVDATPSLFADPVSGIAHVQVSPPTVSFPTGVPSDVMIQVHVRASYTPDAGSEPLPAPIHGDVQAVYRVQPKTLPDGRRVLHVEVSSHDNQIKFFPAATAGLSVADVNKITNQVRAALRNHFEPADLQLPPGFAFTEFKTLGSGPTETVVLPVQLSNAPVPAGGAASLTNLFVGANDFAIAVSKEYIQTFFDQLLDKIRAAAAAFEVTVRFTFVTATYHAALAPNPTVVWKNGSIEVSAKVDLTTNSVAPNGYISFTQAIGMALDVATQTVSLTALGDPSVDESWWLSHDRAVTEVKRERDHALTQASPTVSNTFAGARSKLLNGLNTFDDKADATYQTIEITPDGIILRGAVSAGAWLAPVVHITESVTATGPTLSALTSWIPGGWIERFVWTWPEGPAWFSYVGHQDEEDRFVIPKPAAVAATGRICLRLEGTHLALNGLQESVIGGEVCHPSWTEPILTVPPWWFEAIVPLWKPDWPDRSLTDAIEGTSTSPPAHARRAVSALTRSSTSPGHTWNGRSKGCRGRCLR